MVDYIAIKLPLFSVRQILALLFDFTAYCERHQGFRLNLSDYWTCIRWTSLTYSCVFWRFLVRILNEIVDFSVLYCLIVILKVISMFSRSYY